MNKSVLQALIAQGEGFHLEFKESINSGLEKEIVAFANAKGGMILLGVDDNGIIKNKSFTNGDKSKIQTIARECDPSIDIEIEMVEDEPNVLIIQVSSGLNKPYRCSGGFYMREGANSAKRKTIEIKEMFKDADWFSFDDQLCSKAKFETSFSPLALKRFFAESEKEQILSDEDTLHNLSTLEFIDGLPVFNNTGVLFFTKEPTLFLPQSMIQCVRYKGNEKIDIEDQKDLTFDIITNIDEAFSFLRRSINIGFNFEAGNPKRKEVWEIPYISLREALINAIAHRDYSNRGSHIQIEVFDNRVSITNYGGLVKGLNRSDLGKRSLHRNPNIVNLLHRANFIEKLGTGILRINRELDDAGLPRAKFDISKHWFSITFYRDAQASESTEEVDYDNLTFVLDSRDKSLLTFCLTERSRAEIFEFLNISNNSLNNSRNLVPLIELGLIQMTQPNKPRSKYQKYYTTEFGIKHIT